MFKPPEGKTYTGAWLFSFDYNSAKALVDNLRAKTGKGVCLLGAFSAWEYLIDGYLTRIKTLEQLRKDGVIGGQFFDFGPWRLSLGQTADTTTINEIANGTHDSIIRSWAQAVKAVVTPNTPFYINFGAEFNGEWCGYGADAEAFKSAWKRVHGICSDVGLKADWVIQPNQQPAGAYPQTYPNRRPWKDYYPGDAYVDWIGVSCHDFAWWEAYRRGVTLEQKFLEGEYYQFAQQHGKGFCLPELGTGPNAISWNMPLDQRVRFINDVFALMNKYDIKFYVWYDMVGTGAENTLAKPETLNAYKAGVANVRYLDAIAPPVCTCTAWENRECTDTVVGKRRQTRTCTPTGCDVEERIIDDLTCIAPPVCTCTSWENKECVATGVRRQTRVCTPPGCDLEERLVSDPECVITPPCTCTAWVNAECVGDGKRRQIRACIPAGCAVEERIIDDAACVIPPKVWKIEFPVFVIEVTPDNKIVIRTVRTEEVP